MTDTEILRALRKENFIDSMHPPHTPAWPVFVKQMTHRQYGAQECWDAWLWFKAGWEARP